MGKRRAKPLAGGVSKRIASGRRGEDGDDESVAVVPRPRRIRARCQRVVAGLAPLLALLASLPGGSQDLEAVEFFSGVGSITIGFRCLGVFLKALC
eukprot:14237639-Alexandrium_andersonii.AAC.1